VISESGGGRFGALDGCYVMATSLVRDDRIAAVCGRLLAKRGVPSRGRTGPGDEEASDVDMGAFRRAAREDQLLACPACARHVRVDESRCSLCSARSRSRLRVPGGAMSLGRVGSMNHLWLSPLLLVVIHGCGGEALVGKNVDSGTLDASSAGSLMGDAAAACHSTSDCPGPDCFNEGYSCQGPYPTTWSCVCQERVPCMMDSDCDGGSVCRQDPTVFNSCVQGSLQDGGNFYDGLVCASPCTSDSQCAPTHKCEDAGHCVPRTCAECPSYYSCSSGTCVIPDCTTDTDCPGGYCVNGRCGAVLGFCHRNCG
jgi:hypothetical protein